MKEFFKSIFKGNPALWMIILLLIVISSVLMFSAISSVAYKTTNYLDPFYGHLKHLALGVIILLVMSRIPYKYIRKSYIIFLPLTIVILFITPYIGVTLNGGTRAIRIAGFFFQPQEFAKIFLILCLADILTLYQVNDTDSKLKQTEREKTEKRYFWMIMAAVAATCIPILIQNVSTAVILCVLTYVMMFIGRVDKKKMFALLGIAVGTVGIVLLVLLNISEDANRKLPGHLSSAKHRIERSIEDIKTPLSDKNYEITDENFQSIHGKIAIANGRVPSGPGNSIQRDYLPLAFSDFIFAILIEESGWVGIIPTILAYLVLLFIAGNIISKSDKIYPSLLAAGLCFMIAMQAFISMCVAVGLGPVTGQPLPLISRGGSSIVSTCIMLGIVLSVSRQIHEENNPEEANQEETNEENENIDGIEENNNEINNTDIQ